MALLNPTFFLGLIVLLYLSSFVLFALIRIVTGVSIQRIGYLSLRRLAYTPRDGLVIEIRGLGLNVHRPTFAQPTWVSLVLNELVVTVDTSEQKPTKSGLDHETTSDKKSRASHGRSASASSSSAGNIWSKAARFRQAFKKLHRHIGWLHMVDVVATHTTVNIVGVGHIQLGSLTLAVDTRRKRVGRSQKLHSGDDKKRQAEWIVTLRSLLFTADGGESLEVLDHALFNVHGFLHESRDGLRDVTIAIKLGRVSVPYDDVMLCAAKLRTPTPTPTPDLVVPQTDPTTPPAGDDNGGGQDNEELMQTVTDSREFFSAILRNIKEVQFAVSFAGLTKKITSIKPASSPILLNASMKEVGIDFHRLDPKSPAHRMYFSPKDIAHEALAAALSISIDLDDGQRGPERIVYVPMATTTARTTLPSKTVQLSQESALEERNANILFANSVVTSPSVDLDPCHLPLLIALLQPKPRPPKTHHGGRQQLISRLLPKANIKLSMHEPVVRIRLKPLQVTSDPDDFDLIISSISSVSLDAESSHSPVEDLHYFLDGSIRLQSHSLYYQTCAGEIFNLITTDSLDIKTHLAATPDVCVDITGNIQSFSISMARQEITDGLRQIVRQLHIDVEPDKRAVSKSPNRHNFLRSVPEWLTSYHFEASDFNVEVAGVDEDIADDTRGVSLHLDSFSAEYRAHKLDEPQRRLGGGRRRAHSRLVNQSDSDMAPSTPTSPRLRKKPQTAGDGRRLVLQARGFEAHIVEAADQLEIEPFLRMPRLELVLSAVSDNLGPMFHVQATVRTLLVQYSLYRHYAVGVAVMTLRKALMRTGRDVPRPRQLGTYSNPDACPTSPSVPAGTASTVVSELVTVDVRASLLQVKANMPNDPAMMLHVYGVEAGRHRWSTPYLATKLVRLFVEPPRMRNVWARLLSVHSGRVDLRESRHKTALGGYAEEKMFDVATEAVRLAVPHEVVVDRVTDNVINTMKAVQQLHHRFKTGTNEYILEKKPESAKLLPKTSIRSRNVLLELEDGAFEWKLGIIYRTGRAEQVQRLVREEAFRVKANKVREEAFVRRGSNVRSRSVMSRGRGSGAAAAPSSSSGGAPSGSWFRSRSLDGRMDAPRTSLPRYDPDGDSVRVPGQAKVSEDEARTFLDAYNAQAWQKRIDRAYETSRTAAREMRESFWGDNRMPEDLEVTERILEVPQRPALMAAVLSDFHAVIDKPSFAMRELPEFIHKVGKGMPLDMRYGLLLPMNLTMGMGEVRVSLRDYPLPILHIPSLKPGQSMRSQSLTLKGNLVVAEEFQGVESQRRVRVNVIPARDPGSGASANEGSFAIEVIRTVSAVKSYSDLYMDINTALPTRITWGPSYQPAVQDMMMVVESFTKPQLDPSELVGFWDKLRLNTHSHLHVAWKGDGDMHLSLKGTRDPYQVTGNGAGFLMCWRGDVRWNINVEEDPKRFMTVDSGEYILAVPDYSHLVREAARAGGAGGGGDLVDGGSSGVGGVIKAGAIFKKVAMKLSGKVQWMAGLVFERAIVDGKRNFHSKPHYEVVLKNPIYAKPDHGLPYDAFRGFRSRHIHLSIGVRAPADRQWTPDRPEPSGSYNSVHLTPRVFTHFFDWWGLFSGPMSLPIRQGALFPGQEKNSKKFGRHLATVKYSLLLAPLFLSHIYKHKEAAEDHSESAVSTTGLKVRFENFMLDLHQRREEFNAPGKSKGKKEAPSRISGIKVHEGQLDLAKADVRAVSASLKGTTTEAIRNGTIGPLMADPDEKPDLSRFRIPDHDTSWIDMDDFVELDWILPTEPNPETKILPLAFSPRLTYFRQTDICGTIAGDPTRTSPFGNEPTHFCYMTHDDDPKRVQARLIQGRLDQLEGQMLSHSRNVGEAELKAVQTSSQDAQAMNDLEAMRRHTGDLKDKKAFLEDMLEQMMTTLSQDRPKSSANGKGSNGSSSKSSSSKHSDGVLGVPSTAEFESDYENRFVIHNMEFKWNNVLRNIVLRYIHQVSQRRGFVYYLSRPAVKFLLDIVEEQHKGRTQQRAASPTGTSTPSQTGAESAAETGGTSTTMTTTATTATTVAAAATATTPTPLSAAAAAAAEREEANDLEERIRRMISDGRGHWRANGDGSCTAICDLESGISRDYTPQHGYHVRLIAPQIQLQSERNKGNVVLVTAKGMELKVLEVMDRERISDPVSGLVQRRMLLNMDSTQFFVARRQWFSSSTVSMYAGSRYGTPKGSMWPPWAPMEIMFNFAADCVGFKRVVRKTSAMLRYDKFNNLRLKYGDEVNEEEGSGDGGGSSSSPADSGESLRSDSLWVDFPQVRALCNSSEYYAIYVIVLDLLMYSEPLEKTRSERLEKIMLASDFSDLSGAPLMVQRLQSRIKQMEEIKNQFQVYSKHLDRRGWEDRLMLERDLAASEDELFFVMKAITTAQQKHEANSDTKALLKWIISGRDIVWHLIQDSNEPLVELQLRNVEYDRTDNADGSHTNLVRVGKVLGLNLLPDATYPEMIGPYHTGDEKEQRLGSSHRGRAAFHGHGSSTDNSHNRDMIRVYWHMLEAIAGITVMDRFEVSLYPTRLQLEREAGKLIFDYVFPGMGGDKASATGSEGKNGGTATYNKGHDEDVDDGDDDDADLDDVGESPASSSSRLDNNQATTGADANGGFSTKAGSLELRLRPTLASHATHERASKKAWGGAVSGSGGGGGGGGDREKSGGYSSYGGGDGHGFRLFRSSGTGKTMLAKKSSYDSLRSAGPGGKTAGRSSSVMSSRESSTADSRKGVRFGHRGKSTAADDRLQQQQQQKQHQDDLSKMMSRASNYMTFAYIRMPSVVLCLSYRGREQRNFEDVHDFVFRMPTMEWQNKTWSNLDLALALKKAVMKVLISHTGAIIGNKFSKRRPNAEQRIRLRELANSSVVISSNSSVNQVEEEEEEQEQSSESDDDEGRGREGTEGSGDRGSSRGGESRTRGRRRSRRRRRSYSSGGGVPASLAMTPIDGQEEEEEIEEGEGEDEGLASSHGQQEQQQQQHHHHHRWRAGSSARQSDGRPETRAGSSHEPERRKGTVGFRERFSALKHRKSHREGSGGKG
ncbi:hypothetical protein CP533_6248 [Ophiocordyceps camponoti-saundersi (nom. inval.)]|nr:hypothetical protein CP533_6248 [Ophiocordyceps camponoti-saundersi (nom. inval.)]